MLGRLLKPFLPRGLYWRAALIVFVPAFVILLLMSVVIIQRYYDGVTRQMTGNFVLVAREAMNRIDQAPDLSQAVGEAARLSAAFDLRLTLPATPPPSAAHQALPFYNLTGRIALPQIEAGLPELSGAILANDVVSLWLEGRHGIVLMQFPLTRISANNPHQLLVLFILIGGVMSLISFVYLKNQMRPIRRLAKAAEAFGHGQAVPLRVAGATEVRAAAQAFLDMRERIERHIEQRTLLLSGVSHDLRTPLTRMRLALSMLDDEPEARALLADVVEMESLIDRFLEFVRDEAVETEVTTDLRALIDQRVEEAARAGRTVCVVGPQSGPAVALRPQLFSRAIDNLISNALRHGTRAQVSIEVTDDAVVVSVEDDGPGIAPDCYARATRPFVRLDSARGASSGSGVGLGLAIVADAMRAHGGRLELDRGTTPGYGGLLARLVLPRRRSAR